MTPSTRLSAKDEIRLSWHHHPSQPGSIILWWHVCAATLDHFDGFLPTIVSDSFLVTVPATTANIGPGFDCLGAALTLYNHFRFTRLTDAPGTVKILVSGQDASRVSTAADNLAYRAFTAVYQHLNQAVPGIELAIELHVPLARGLGSSSTAIIGGLLGANAIAGHPLTIDEIAELAINLEGHPDNVVPALLGGCRLAVQNSDDPWVICDVPWHPSLRAVVLIPDFELSTAAARKVLPPHYTKADAIFNTAHLGLLLRGLETGNGAWLEAALRDRIHQPYRKTLIPGFDTAHQAAQEAGAYGLVISGAGPTLLAIAPQESSRPVMDKVLQIFQDADYATDGKILALDLNGTQVKRL